MLVFLNMFTGGFAIMTYAGKIFRDSGSSINPHLSSIIVGCSQVAGSYTSTIVIDQAGRKILLIISLTGIVLGHSVLGVFNFLSYHYDVTPYSYVSIISVSFFIFMACLGILTVPLILLSEILPAKIRSYGSLICFTIMFVFGAIILKIFPILVEMLELYTCMWIFAVISALGIVFISVAVTETKGKNLILAAQSEIRNVIKR